jgi:hypothetical protein
MKYVRVHGSPKMSAVEDLQHLAESCSGKRMTLLVSADRKTRARKLLNVAADILALLSAASLTAIIAEFTNSRCKNSYGGCGIPVRCHHYFSVNFLR